MNIDPNAPRPYEHDWTELDRRNFLKLLGAGAAVAGVVATGLGSNVLGAAPAAAAGPGFATAAPLAERTLVVLDCAGGMDGMSFLIPYADPQYVLQRPDAHINPASVLQIDSEVGMHPLMTRLHARGLAWIQGVGIPVYDLSHFESLRRWWTGDQYVSATVPPGGWLGRLCDIVGDPGAPTVGVSLGFGPSAALVSSQVATVPFNPYGDFALPRLRQGSATDAAWEDAFRAAAQPVAGDAAWTALARKGINDLVRFVDVLAVLPDGAGGYPDSTLGVQLELAARILDANTGVRVLHVPVFHDFDTHSNHVNRTIDHVTDIDACVDRFLDDVAGRGLGDSTLVMQQSEFGRRGISNSSNGLDHGATNQFFLAGPVNPGRYGIYPSFGDLDDELNLTPTVTMTEYMATVIEGWFGVDAALMLEGDPQPIPGVFA